MRANCARAISTQEIAPLTAAACRLAAEADPPGASAISRPPIIGAVKSAARPKETAAGKARPTGSRQPLRRQVPTRNAPTAARGVLWSRPGYLVRRLNQVHYALFFEECGEARMTPVQYGLLSALRKKPRGLDQNSLATELGLDRTTTSDVLRRLESRGLLARVKSTTDKRMNIVTLTAPGRRTVLVLDDSMRRAQERLLEPLPAAERERFMRDLVHLVESFDRIGLHAFKDL